MTTRIITDSNGRKRITNEPLLHPPLPVQPEHEMLTVTNQLSQAAQMALEALDSENPDIQLRAALALRTVLEQQQAKPVQEPWGACVSGRVFVGRLPEHARKISEDEGAPIQWLYTTPPLPVQEPVAWVTVEGGVWVSTRSADFRHIADGQYQLYAGPLQNDIFAAISTLKAIGYVYDNGKFCKEGEQWIAPTASQPPLPVQRPWVGLTDEEIKEIHNASVGKDVGFATGLTEAKLKEKNTT